MEFGFIFLIILVLFWDGLNGMHDAANSVSTIVSTRVLSPKYAVLWASFFNLIGFLFLGLGVASTIGKGIINPNIIDNTLILSALLSAISWNLFTWKIGFPSSSSHALIGGLLGAGIAKVGIESIIWTGLLPTIMAIFLSPTIGFLLSLLLMLIVFWCCKSFLPYKIDGFFRFGQLFSSALYSIGHSNDAQKSMGIITILLLTNGYISSFYVPLWVILSCQISIALGTLCGGWKIIKTMGDKLTHIKPIQGFCAETAGAITLFGATHFGIPNSSTHVIMGSIVGAGSAQNLSSVKWSLLKNIVLAWIITIPITGLFSFLLAKVFQ